MLVTVGRYDQVAVPAGAESVAKKIPEAKLIVFGHSGRSVPADEPGKFHETINKFLEPIYKREHGQGSR